MLRSFVFCLACWPLAALAQPNGTNYSAFEVGTQFHYSYSEIFGSGSYFDVYKGIKNDNYIVHRFGGLPGRSAKLRRINTYDAAGRLIEIRNLAFDSRWVFEPFDCVRSGLARCEHAYTIYDLTTGAKKSTHYKVYETKLRGRTLHIVENADTNRIKSTIKLDENNLMLERREIIRMNGEDRVQTDKLDRIITP